MRDPAHIYNWKRIDRRLTTSGQPTEAELADLAGIDVRRVVNLAPHDHARALADEAASVARLGMGYENIPVDFKRPTEADYAAFRAAMAGEDALHVHCGANYRVSAFLYRCRVEELGMDEARARADLLAVWQPDEVWAAFVEDARRRAQAAGR